MCHWTGILERDKHQVRKDTKDLRHVITAQNCIAYSLLAFNLKYAPERTGIYVDEIHQQCALHHGSPYQTKTPARIQLS
jgi:hypothetical protein